MSETMFIQARFCGPLRDPGVIDWIVIHTMEAPEKPHTARAVAEWFASDKSPKASAHYCIDDGEIIQCVSESVVAWGAPGANQKGIHLEHAGFASQIELDWDDIYSRTVLENSAERAADICKRYQIPAVHLSVDELRQGMRGFCGHIDVTNAFNGGHGHTDPGPNFPWDRYLGHVSLNLLDGSENPPPHEQA